MEKNYVRFSYPLTITNFEEWVHIISYLKGPNTQTVNQICSVDFIFFDKFQFFKNFLWTLTKYWIELKCKELLEQLWTQDRFKNFKLQANPGSSSNAKIELWSHSNPISNLLKQECAETRHKNPEKSNYNKTPNSK